MHCPVASLSEDVATDAASSAAAGETQFPGEQIAEDVDSAAQGSNAKDSAAIKIVNDGKLIKDWQPDQVQMVSIPSKQQVLIIQGKKSQVNSLQVEEHLSFAIRAKENDMLPLEKNRVKLDDDSDEEEEEGKEGQENASGTSSSASLLAPSSSTPEEKKPQLTQEELEAKQAKQKLEDRLAAAAREKLAQASKESKEKQLQAERKRKAALFLQNLKNPLADMEVEKMEE
ncbi:hypothetical protein Chor_010652, partial [Crotalus horridus]